MLVNCEQTSHYVTFLIYTKVTFFIFIQLIWQMLKQLSPSGSVNTTIHIPSGDSCILVYLKGRNAAVGKER